MAVAEGIGSDKRIGPAFLSPGPGFGGSCFPKDTRAFAAIGRRFRTPQTLVETLITNNEARKVALGRRILVQLGERPGGKRLAVLGTAFKANTDDMREAAALTIIPMLQDAGVEVTAHDPKAQEAAQSLLPGICWCGTPYAAAKGADVIVILTDWEEYRHLDIGRFAQVMRGDTVIDYRNVLDPDAVAAVGLHYLSLGRPTITPRSARRRREQAGGGARAIDVAAAPP